MQDKKNDSISTESTTGIKMPKGILKTSSKKTPDQILMNTSPQLSPNSAIQTDYNKFEFIQI
jgi:hypothetical protein